MIAYIVRRLFSTLVVMAVVAFVVFSLLYLTPGDPAAVIAGDIATDEDIRRIHARLGLDDPFLVQFGRWLWSLAHGDLGTSIFTNLPVTQLIGQRVEPTVSLTLCTLVVAILVAVPLGVVAAAKAGTWLDRAVMSFSVLGFSVPVFVFAYILILTFSVQLDWLPVQGYRSFRDGVWEWLRHLILPSIALGTVYVALITRMTRAGAGADRPCAQERGDSRGDDHRCGRRTADQRRDRHRDGVRAARHRTPHRRRDPAPRLSHHPGRDPHFFRGLRAGQSGGRSFVRAVRPADTL